MATALPFVIRWPMAVLQPDGPFVEVGRCASADLFAGANRFLSIGCDLVDEAGLEVPGVRAQPAATA